MRAWLLLPCSGSTIVGVGDPEPPQFIYDEERYQDVFTEGAPRRRSKRPVLRTLFTFHKNELRAFFEP